MRKITASHLSVPALIALAALTFPLIGSGQAGKPAWVTTWASSQQALGTTSVSHATVRMIARLTIPGDAVRIRLDNTFGTVPLTVGSGYVGIRAQGPALVAGSNRRILFSHSPTVVIPPGGTVESDPVPMKVLGWQDLAVSLYIPDSNVHPSQHTNADVTSYLGDTGAGDFAADEGRAHFSATTTAMFWLKSIDVQTSTPAAAIVAFGDSITDGTCTTVDGHDRWVDWLAIRLDQEHRASHSKDAVAYAVLNEGIGGNTVTREVNDLPDSPPGIERLDRDVLSHYGVKYVILFMGTNDIRRGAFANQVSRGTQDIIQRLKMRGLKVIGATIVPRHNLASVPGNSGWDSAKTRIRNEVNEWIRRQAPFDALIDFDRVVQDPANPDLYNPAFTCGDGIHPSPRGYYEMGQSVDLRFFRSSGAAH